MKRKFLVFALSAVMLISGSISTFAQDINLANINNFEDFKTQVNINDMSKDELRARLLEIELNSRTDDSEFKMHMEVAPEEAMAMINTIVDNQINELMKEIKEINVTPSTEVTLNAGESSQLIPWPACADVGYWKIYLKNTSLTPARVRIFKDTPDGPQVGETMIIPAGQRLPFYCDPSSPLENSIYYLEVNTNDSYNLNGTLYYKFATNYDYLYL